MASKAVNSYIAVRYNRWLDYSSYHCSIAGIKDEAIDVLNEVLYSLLLKEESFLDKLFESKKSSYTALDFFVLRMIKLNVFSPTSPYQNKYRGVLVDDNADYSRMDIEDVADDDGEDKNEILLKQMHQVRAVFENLDLSPLAKRIFEFRFFHDLSFSEWEGKETIKQLYEIYNGVQSLIKRQISGESLF